jgi:hypothetical protein
MAGIQEAALAAVARLFDAEAQAAPDARPEHRRRVIVAGPHRVEVPRHVSEPIAQLAMHKLHAACGGAYMETDGALPFGAPKAGSSARGEAASDVLRVLRARRAAHA